jgi:2-polyprenyl-3-methyl-5-hydroxy-6-metoxy-1,4-benzoquinol methylase
MAARGCTVVGIDVNSLAVEAARSTGAYASVGTIDLDDKGAELPAGPFDVVLCGDVLEHLADPENALARLTSAVAHGGWMIVSVPNVAHISIRVELLRGRFHYSDSGILDRTHLHFYTHESARTLVESAGLSVEAVLSGSNRFGSMLSFGPRPVRVLRGLLAYNIVIVGRRLTDVA